MGMGRTVSRFVSRVDCNDVVGMGFVNPIPAEDNVELSEIDAFQNDLISADAKLFHRSFDHDGIKLAAQRLDLSIQSRGGDRHRLAIRLTDARQNNLGPLTQ